MAPTASDDPAAGEAPIAASGPSDDGEAGDAGVARDDAPGGAARVGGSPGPRGRTPRAARLGWGILAIILIGVTGLIVYALTRGTTAEPVSHPPVTSSDVLATLSSVPTSVYDAASPASALLASPPTVLHGQPALTKAGKPEVLFVGGEFCPFCAAERWPLVLALSRFGKFSVLHNVQSAPNSAFSALQSFSFLHDAYSSPYLSFTGVELYSDTVDAGGGYARIGTLSSGQAQLVSHYGAGGGAPGPSDLPFVDVANRMVATTSAYTPAIIVGQSQSAIVAGLGNASTPIGGALLGAANQLAAGICAATGQRPENVCSSKGVRDADTALGLAAG